MYKIVNSKGQVLGVPSYAFAYVWRHPSRGGNTWVYREHAERLIKDPGPLVLKGWERPKLPDMSDARVVEVDTAAQT